TSSDSEYEEGSDDAFEDLNSPYKKPKPTPFTQRITHFKYHKRAKLPWNIRLRGAKSEVLGRIFATKIYAKDPTEIHGIKRRQNEGLQAFMDRFKSESSHIKGVPPVLRISAFMHGHSHPELAKKLNNKIPKTVNEMFERVRAFIRGEVVAGSAEMVCPSQGDKGYVCLAWTRGPERARNRGGPREARRNMGVYTPYPRKDTFTSLTKTLKEILTMESVSFPKPLPLIGTPEKQNLDKFCGYHGNRGHNTNDCYQLKKQIEEAVASGKLAHLVKDIRRNNQRNGNQGRNGVKERPDQYVTMGATLTTNCKQLLADVVRENMEVFAWTGSERTTVSRFVMEHKLKIYPLAEPVVHKRRPIAPEGRLALKEKVFRWIGEGLIRKVLHPEWITNAILIKLTNGTWKVHMDYSCLNKACAKDMYPLPEEIEKLASLMGYPYKCFLQLPKEYNQIRMAEEDEEKTGFHTEERIYCFTDSLESIYT
ncbi:hypothetical protein Tco_0961812, partial [Tanacetum coccineum]